MAGGLGFDPRLAESESAVLRLDDPPPGITRGPEPVNSTQACSCVEGRAPRHRLWHRRAEAWLTRPLRPLPMDTGRERGGWHSLAFPLLRPGSFPSPAGRPRLRNGLFLR